MMFGLLGACSVPHHQSVGVSYSVKPVVSVVNRVEFRPVVKHVEFVNHSPRLRRGLYVVPSYRTVEKRRSKRPDYSPSSGYGSGYDYHYEYDYVRKSGVPYQMNFH